MRQASLATFIAALLAAAAFGQTLPASTSDKVPIAGRVVNGVSGVPLDRIRVVIAPALRPDLELAAQMTGADGAFSFLMKKGDYQLIAESSGIGRQFYGTRGLADSYGVGIIADGTRTYDRLVFPVYPPSAISGQLLDNFGDPVEGALVQLLRYTFIGGKKRLSARGYDYSNDKGEYRFGNLVAGTYFLVAGGTPWHEQNVSGSVLSANTPKTSYLPVYFPNSTNPASAAPLVLKAGSEVRANMNLMESEGYRIRVRATGTFTGALRLQLTAAGVEAVNRFQKVSTFYGPDQVIPAVPPGTYKLLLLGQNGNDAVAASADIQLSSADADVSLTVKPTAGVSGQITCDGKPLPANNSAVITLWQGDVNQGQSRRVQSDSKFRFPAMPPAKYTVLLANIDCYLTRVQQGDSEFPARTFELTSNSIDNLNLEAARGFARLKGILTHRGEPLSGAMVLLAPVAESIDPVDYPSYKTDSDGSFDFRYVRPGEYYLYAVDDPEFEFANRKVIKPYLERAIKISIEPFSKSTKDFELTTIK